MIFKDNLNLREFPFKMELSIKPLIDYWENMLEGKNSYRDHVISEIRQELKTSPELLEPFTSDDVIEKHYDLIKCLFHVIFPEAFWDQRIFAAMHPFTLKSFIHSGEYGRIIKPIEDSVPEQLNMPADILLERRKVGMYSFILRKFYGIASDTSYPFVYRYDDPETGLDRYLKFNLAAEFMDVKLNGELKKLTDEELEFVRENVTDYEAVSKILPPENFTLSGFMILNAVDVTDQEIVSSMKQDLIRKDALNTHLGFLRMQEKMQSLLRSQDLLMGIVELPAETNALFENGREIVFSFVMDNKEIDCDCIENSLYNKVYDTREPVLINNLEQLKEKTPLEEKILEQGIKNVFLAPIMFDERLVGVLEIGAKKAGVITPASILRLETVIPLFGVALARGMEDLENEIQSIIKEECTAIHPSVEWRFRDAALKFIRKREDDEYGDMEEIVFRDVYPLYGLSDIRNSSTIRNEAIKEDLITNLNMANEIIHTANTHRSLHSLDELNYRIGKQIESINFGLGSGDELVILNFLKNEIEPIFKHIRDYDIEVAEAIERYKAQIDPELGFIYKRRRMYEESVSKLTDVICNHLEHEQIAAQKIFPHYFERYKTDGVDHTMYIGQSMVQRNKFDQVYLKNLRLWQLITTCSIVRKSKAFKKHLEEPIDIANLILVQNVPLAIRFRYDEKQFDVDGAYNVRYEIIKKRIDKAEIKGGEERLTQPGKIAIVYSHQGEADEYLEYIDYLNAHGYLEKEIEQLELENLQGVNGLKALRVTVNMDEKLVEESLSEKEIESVLKI